MTEQGQGNFLLMVDGEPVPARPGWTVGVALTAAGRRAWRTTRFGGRPRGLFCGIGICFDCLLTVNGVGSQRACLVPAQPGDVIETDRGVTEP